MYSCEFKQELEVYSVLGRVDVACLKDEVIGLEDGQERGSIGRICRRGDYFLQHLQLYREVSRLGQSRLNGEGGRGYRQRNMRTMTVRRRVLAKENHTPMRSAIARHLDWLCSSHSIYWFLTEQCAKHGMIWVIPHLVVVAAAFFIRFPAGHQHRITDPYSLPHFC